MATGGGRSGVCEAIGELQVVGVRPEVRDLQVVEEPPINREFVYRSGVSRWCCRLACAATSWEQEAKGKLCGALCLALGRREEEEGGGGGSASVCRM